MISSDLLQAVKTPLVLASGTILIISVFTLLLAQLRRSPRANVVGRMAKLAILFSLIIGVIIAYQSYMQIRHDREFSEMHALYSVHAEIKGTVQTRTLSEPVTFRVSSGQVNVGCGDRQQTNAAFTVPRGATEVQVSAGWQNTNNVKDQTQAVNPNPPIVTATGSISGLDRNLFGNCPGGGHGELVLIGSYRLPRDEAHGQQTLKSLDAKLNKGEAFSIAVPHDVNTRPESCEITVTEGTRKELIRLELTVSSQGAISIPNRTISNTGAAIPVDITNDKDRIYLRIL